MMKKTAFYSILFLIFLVGTFFLVLYILPPKIKTNKTENSVLIPYVISQDLQYIPNHLLVSKGIKAWTAKKYKISFNFFQVAYHKIEPETPLYHKAVLYLGLQYYYGQGTKQNQDKAYLLFSKPFLAKNRLSLFLSGLILKNKKSSYYDLKKAKILLTKAKEMGVSQADIELGKIDN